MSKLYRDTPDKNENSAIIYSTSCHSKLWNIRRNVSVFFVLAHTMNAFFICVRQRIKSHTSLERHVGESIIILILGR